jgi:glyoxylase-like metal-dependent hydrolase (beta-lactamase superfamily II)/8-oxo-dGTP pyrophosphatase MutT (NUDIX family)
VSAITPAASVLLSRGPDSREVFAVKRSAQLKFFGNFWAFPGGRLDAADLALAGAPLTANPPPQRSEGEIPLEALRIAACRELFEEAGVLVARPFPSAGEELHHLRRDLLESRISFAHLLGQQGLRIHAEDFRHVGQLTTPPFSQVRFATTFFEAHLPPGQRAEVWPGELEEGRWAEPSQLLSDWHSGKLLLTPPAVTILESVKGEPINAAATILGPIFARQSGDALPEIFFAPDVQAIPLRTAVLPPATHTNAYLVGPYLIDPGPDDPAEQQRLLNFLDAHRRNGGRIEAILMTHHHRDHIGAAALCARHLGVPICAHPITAELLSACLRVDRLLNDGDTVPLGWAHPDPWEPGLVLQVLHTRGHAQGHLAFYEGFHGLLFAGDMVSTQTSIVVYPPDGDLARYLESLQRLRTLPARLLLPSHGLPSARPHEVIDEALAHRAKREKQLLEALAAGPTTIEALTPVLYRGVPEALWRLARAQILAGLIKLQREGRARPSDGERWELAQ